MLQKNPVHYEFMYLSAITRISLVLRPKILLLCLFKRNKIKYKELIPSMKIGTDKFSASLYAFIHSNKKASLEWGKNIDFLSSLITLGSRDHREDLTILILKT